MKPLRFAFLAGFVMATACAARGGDAVMENDAPRRELRRGASHHMDRLLETLRTVGPNGVGHREAARAWEALAQTDAAQLPTMLSALDGAGPLAANWIRTSIDAVAERQLQQGRALPTAELERFVLDQRHAPRARCLAFEWLSRASPAARQRLVAGMLDDPSIELSREAVARCMEQAGLAKQAGKTGEAIEAYRRALEAARDLDQVAACGERLRELGQPADPARRLGYVTHWKLIGPFDNTGRRGYAVAYPPEQEVRFEAAYQGKQRPQAKDVTVRWVDFTSKEDAGTINFQKAFGEQREVAGYAATEFYARRRQAVEGADVLGERLEVVDQRAPGDRMSRVPHGKRAGPICQPDRLGSGAEPDSAEGLPE